MIKPMQLSRLAFVGVRGHQGVVLRSLPRMPNVRVVGLCDGGAEPIDSLIEWCRTNGHQPEVYQDYGEMLANARPHAVVICGPFEQHASMTIDAMERGIHVLTEKPAALTIEDLERLRTAVERHPHVHLAGMQTARFEAGFYTARQLVRQGAIGDVRLINARKSYKLGKRGLYYTARETYGGTIPWVGSHAIDWVLWIGGHRIRSAYATHSAACNEGLGTMERSALCHFTLCGERFASVSIDVFRPANAKSHGDDWIRIVGTEGVLEARPNAVTLINASNDGTVPVPLETPPSMFEDFAACVEGRSPGLNGPHDTLATTAACLLARQSADDGRVIEAESFTSIPMTSKQPTEVKPASEPEPALN